MGDEGARRGLRETLFHVIFEADTPAGKAFDVALIGLIAASVVAVLLESVGPIRARHGEALRAFEWLVTVAFTLEYGLRLACVAQPLRYATSFFGVVDLLAVVPTYLSLLLPGSQSLLVIRALRLLRVMRVFKLATYLSEASFLLRALRASRDKILVFLGTVMIVVLVVGALMYLIEGAESGFTSIPRAMYWAIVTMTTVGYGDIAPGTVVGQLLAAALMMLGYAIIAVPTGIVTAEMFEARRAPVTTRGCPECLSEGHDPSARYCRDCGAALPAVGSSQRGAPGAASPRRSAR
jgi:voltage-gated potassium channel